MCHFHFQLCAWGLFCSTTEAAVVLVYHHDMMCSVVLIHNNNISLVQAWFIE